MAWHGNSAEYARAHKAARRRLGERPSVCPTCGKPAKENPSGRTNMQLSYTGTEGFYDVTGILYVYECASCNMKRSAKPHTAEHKAKISASEKGIPKSEEHKAKIATAQRGKSSPFKGVPRSPEVKAKISAAKTGIPKSPEHRAKMSAARKGVKRSEEFKAKVSAGMKAYRAAQREARAIDSLIYVGGVQ